MTPIIAPPPLPAQVRPRDPVRSKRGARRAARFPGSRRGDAHQKNLRQRGWTAAAIGRFLGAADALKRRPASRSPVYLHDQDRVLAVEATPAFRAWLPPPAKSDPSEAARLPPAAPRNWSSRSRGMPITLPALPLSMITAAAIRRYNEVNTDRIAAGTREPASTACEVAFLHRISVNYLRHRASRYDRMLNEIAGLPGVRDAYLVLFERMMLAIAGRYPEPAGECQRQFERRTAIGASLSPVF